MSKPNNGGVTKPRSQRDLLAQLKSLVAASGNEKKFLLAHDALNVDKVGRTTVYDALHGKKIGIKLTALLDAIKGHNEGITAAAVEFTNNAIESDLKRLNKSTKQLKKASKAVKSDSPSELSRPISAYVKQLQSLISASGSERKFFADYAKFNVAGAVRSSVYTAVHDGKVRSALAQMLDAIFRNENGGGFEPSIAPKSRRKAKAVHGVEVLPGDNLEEVQDAGN